MKRNIFLSRTPIDPDTLDITQTIESNKIDNQDKANIQEDQVSQLDEEDDKNSSAEKEVEAQASNLDGKNIEPKDISDNLPTADKDNLIDLRRDETHLSRGGPGDQPVLGCSWRQGPEPPLGAVCCRWSSSSSWRTWGCTGWFLQTKY